MSDGSIDERVVSELTRGLGPGKISLDQEDREAHSIDALGSFRAFYAGHLLASNADLVVRAGTVEDVAEVLRVAAASGVPVVPYGGGTGVMGGIVPVKRGISLDIRGLDRIWEIDRESRTVTVGAGVLLGDLDDALGRKGLILGHDPWSRPIATVGGAISTNGVGYLAGRYGPMGEQVLGLQVVLPGGRVLETRGVSKPSPGPNLAPLFIGSEGTLGVITRATLRVFPAPERRSLHALGFDSFESGFTAIMECFALGLQPSLVDFSEEVEASGSRETVLYLGFEGTGDEVGAQERRALAICRSHGARDLGDDEARAFWDNRHASAERYRREVQGQPAAARRSRGGGWRMDYLHVAIPASRVLEYRRRCAELLQGYEIPVREWSVWGRPDLFSFLISAPAEAADGSGERMAHAVDEVLSMAQDMGGTMEYCHGFGLKLRHLMDREWATGAGMVRRIKEALDPGGVLNPGKLWE